MSSDDEDQVTILEPKTVGYCPHCTFPLEYCEYSPKWEKCAANLNKVDPELLEKLRALRISSGREKPKAAAAPAGEPKEGEDGVDTVDVAEDDLNEDDENEDDGDDDGDDDDDAPAPAKAAKREIVIQVKDRTRRKHVTTVTGLESVGLKSKEIGKVFSKKFATSASVSKEGITLNGDLSYDIAEYLLDQYSENVQKTDLYTMGKGNIKKRFF